MTRLEQRELDKILRFVARLPVPPDSEPAEWDRTLSLSLTAMSGFAELGDWPSFAAYAPIHERIRIIEMLRETSLRAEAVQAALAECWLTERFPDYELAQPRIIRLFRSLGFFSNAGLPRPRENIRLYRGADDQTMRGVSWTPSPVVANAYARLHGSHYHYVGDGRVFVAEVPPARVLARLQIHGFEEYVVDPAGIEISAWESLDDSASAGALG